MTPIQEEIQAKYGVDYEKQLREILPYFWSYTIDTDLEKSVFLDYAYTLFSQFKKLNFDLVEFNAFIKTRLNYTGQKLALVEMLNDNFDNDLRRITLECLNRNFVEGLDIYNNGEVDETPLIVFNNNESNPIPITIFNNNETSDTDSLYGKSFIIYVPVDVLSVDQTVRALLDIYVIAPQEYLIERI